MNFSLIIILSLLSLLSCESSFKKPITDVNHLSPNIGFISDAEYVSKEECFKPFSTIADSSQISSMMTLYPLSFSELTHEFGISSIPERYQFHLHSDLLMDYLNEIYEDPFSFSFNFLMAHVGSKEMTYPKTSNKINIDEILTLKGLQIYNKGNNNNQFRVICGDRLIASYTYGIALIFSVRVTFTNQYDKKLFKNRITSEGFKTQGMKGIIQQIQSEILHSQFNRYCDKYGEKIEILGIQLGGDADEFNYLNYKDFDNGDFVLASCDIVSIEDCVNSQYGLQYIQSYIDNNFYEQWRHYRKYPMNQLVVMGAVHRFFETNPLTKYGLDVGKSYITEEVQRSKEHFMQVLKDNVALFKHVKHWYALAPFSNKKLTEYFELLQDNINVYLTNNRGVNCYRDPVNFLSCYNDIMSEIKPIPTEEIIEFSKELLFVDEYYDVVISNNFCLPQNFNWDSKYQMRINFLNKKIVTVKTDYTKFQCYLIEDVVPSFECRDSIFSFHFMLQDNRDNTATLTCLEKNFNYVDLITVPKGVFNNLYEINDI